MKLLTRFGPRGITLALSILLLMVWLVVRRKQWEPWSTMLGYFTVGSFFAYVATGFWTGKREEWWWRNAPSLIIGRYIFAFVGAVGILIMPLETPYKVMGLAGAAIMVVTGIRDMALYKSGKIPKGPRWW
ncbi:MAG: hypothetical protein ACREJQ_02125 [bacterium]